jgi:hypothetical protein
VSFLHYPEKEGDQHNVDVFAANVLGELTAPDIDDVTMHVGELYDLRLHRDKLAFNASI